MRPKRIHALIEAVIGFVLGVASEVVNVIAFSNSTGGAVLAFGLIVGGALLSVQRFSIERAVEDELQPVRALSTYVDLGRTSNYQPILPLAAAYSSIVEPEFAPLKQKIVADSTRELERLANTKRSDTIETAEYYDWLSNQFARMKKGDYVRAISLSSDLEWNDSEFEKNFLEENLDAAKRGVNVTRIFIIEPDRLSAFVRLKPIDAHTDEHESNLKGRWVDRRDFEKSNARLLKELRDGFIDFNGRVGLEDRIDESGEARGEVTLHPGDLSRMATQYQQIYRASSPLKRID